MCDDGDDRESGLYAYIHHDLDSKKSRDDRIAEQYWELIKKQEGISGDDRPGDKQVAEDSSEDIAAQALLAHAGVPEESSANKKDRIKGDDEVSAKEKKGRRPKSSNANSVGNVKEDAASKSEKKRSGMCISVVMVMHSSA